MSLDGDPLDEDYVRTRLKQPPFVTIDGVLNIRDLGSYQTADPSLITKPSLMYRSGEVSGITGEGVDLISPHSPDGNSTLIDQANRSSSHSGSPTSSTSDLTRRWRNGSLQSHKSMESRLSTHPSSRTRTTVRK
jgi:hypothetical protein